MRYGERTQQRLIPLAFGRLGSPAGLDRPFEMVWRELPKWDCAQRLISNAANDDDRLGHRRRGPTV